MRALLEHRVMTWLIWCALLIMVLALVIGVPYAISVMNEKGVRQQQCEDAGGVYVDRSDTCIARNLIRLKGNL